MVLMLDPRRYQGMHSQSGRTLPDFVSTPSFTSRIPRILRIPSLGIWRGTGSRLHGIPQLLT